MKKRAKSGSPRRATPLSTGAAAARLMTESARAGTAASITIAHRSARIAAAFADPRALADPELTRMSAEKVSGGIEAAGAMMARLPAFQLGLGMVAWSHAMALGTALAEVAFCRSVAEAMAIQQRLAAAMLEPGARLAADTVAIAAAGWRPLHRRVAANAQRLTRESMRLG